MKYKKSTFLNESELYLLCLNETNEDIIMTALKSDRYSKEDINQAVTKSPMAEAHDANSTPFDYTHSNLKDTPLHAAARQGKFRVFAELIKRGADFEVRDLNGQRPVEASHDISIATYHKISDLISEHKRSLNASQNTDKKTSYFTQIIHQLKKSFLATPESLASKSVSPETPIINSDPLNSNHSSGGKKKPEAYIPMSTSLNLDKLPSVPRSSSTNSLTKSSDGGLKI